MVERTYVRGYDHSLRNKYETRFENKKSLVINLSFQYFTAIIVSAIANYSDTPSQQRYLFDTSLKVSEVERINLGIF